MADISLIVKKTGVSREHDQPSTSNRHIVSSSPLCGWELNSTRKIARCNF
jgi:hypothetical protein